jgi:hypothetical protein
MWPRFGRVAGDGVGAQDVVGSMGAGPAVNVERGECASDGAFAVAEALSAASRPRVPVAGRSL